MDPPGKWLFGLLKPGISPVLCGFPDPARRVDACHCRKWGQLHLRQDGGELAPLRAGRLHQAVNRPDSRGTRVMPMRATPPPAMSCFMPWLFAHVR